MEHREPHRKVRADDPPGEGADPFQARRFARFVPTPSVRKLAPSRVGLALLASAGILGLSVLASSQLLQSLVRYVHGQKGYRLDARDVILDPPPPSWFRGGKDGFLARVHLGGGQDEPTSVLDLDLDRISQILRNECWVKKVVRIRRLYPNRLELGLVYRVPVAYAHFEGNRRVVVDEEGVILPAEDIAWESLDHPVLFLKVDVPPVEEKPGTVWKRQDRERGLAVPDEGLHDAAQLAGFLREAQGKGGRIPQAIQLNLVSPRADERGLFAMNRTINLWVCWGDPPGSKAAGRPSAETKWSWLCKWAKEHPDEATHFGKYPYYLEFTTSGVRRHPTAPKS